MKSKNFLTTFSVDQTTCYISCEPGNKRASYIKNVFATSTFTARVYPNKIVNTLQALGRYFLAYSHSFLSNEIAAELKLRVIVSKTFFFFLQ